nr:thiamine pyrophosphate-dependent enzyme [Brachybacterium muris]
MARDPAVDLGAGLSRPDHRPVLFIGDGSLQLTATELGTLYQRVPQAVVFLLENRGYTVERCIQSPHAVYQDILAWDWPAVPAALGAPQVHTPRVGTLRGLAEALAEVTDRPDDGFFITVDLPMMDAPRLLRVLAEGIGTLNARD